MLSAAEWTPNQPNIILFTAVDSAGLEVTGLGGTFTVQISKAGAAFMGGLGAKAEIGLGAYKYTTTASEADTFGPVYVVVTGPGIVQQNLEYVVGTRVASAVEFTYTLTDAISTNPIAGALVWFSSDVTGQNIVWTGSTNALGVAVDSYGNLPLLTVGPIYAWASKSGYQFANPDIENVV